MYFEPVDTTAESYQWLVGNEATPRTGKRIAVGFTKSVVPESPIKVTCIAKKKPDSNCFPNDNGVDTVTRFIYFFDPESDKKQHQPPIFGKYYGYDDKDTSIKYTIEIFYKAPFGVRIKNICRECEPQTDASAGITGNSFYSIMFPSNQNSQFKEYPDLPGSFIVNCWFWECNRSFGRLVNGGQNIYIEYEYYDKRILISQPDGSKDYKYVKTIFKGKRVE